MLLEHERNYALGMKCSGHRMLLERERNYALGMDALVTVCSWNMNGIMLWAWMLWSPYALQHEWKGHKCNPEKTCVSLDAKVNRWLLLLLLLLLLPTLTTLLLLRRVRLNISLPESLSLDLLKPWLLELEQTHGLLSCL